MRARYSNTALKILMTIPLSIKWKSMKCLPPKWADFLIYSFSVLVQVAQEPEAGYPMTIFQIMQLLRLNLMEMRDLSM